MIPMGGMEGMDFNFSEMLQDLLPKKTKRRQVSVTEARRILLTLQTLGYVASDGRNFTLTPRILDLGFAYLSSMPIWNLAEPVMEEIRKGLEQKQDAPTGA